MISNKNKLIKKSKIKFSSSRLSLKRTKKNSINSINTQTNSNVFVNILYNTPSSIEIINKLKYFYKTNIDNKKFLKYEKAFITFDKSIQGKSGSIVGYLKNKPDSVLKVHYLKTNINKLIYYDGCVQLNNKFNEIFMNIIFKNIEYFPNFTSNEVKEVKKHILEIEDYGFGNSSYYILMPLVGMNYIDKNNKNKKHFMTNLKDVMNLNHSPFLKKALKENNTEMLDLFDEFLAESLSSLFNVFKILQKNLNFVNGDAKLANIFIKSQKNTKSKFNKLREYGFVIDYGLLLADLEKVNITINNNKFLTYPNFKNIPEILIKLAGVRLINKIRHSCDVKMNKLCPNLTINDYDILCIIIDFYTRFLKIDINFINYFSKTNELYKQFLSISDINYNKLIKILKKGDYNLNSKVAPQLSRILTKIC